MSALHRLPYHDREGRIQVVVEAPRGSPVKLKYEQAREAFFFHRALPRGVTYPFDWGFVPSTRAQDGDPLDAMILFDGTTYPGVVVPTQPIGVIRVAQRSEGGKPERNDRILVVPAGDNQYARADDIPDRLRKDLERFFVLVGKLSNDEVEVTGWEGPQAAIGTVEEAAKRCFGSAQ